MFILSFRRLIFFSALTGFFILPFSAVSAPPKILISSEEIFVADGFIVISLLSFSSSCPGMCIYVKDQNLCALVVRRDCRKPAERICNCNQYLPKEAIKLYLDNTVSGVPEIILKRLWVLSHLGWSLVNAGTSPEPCEVLTYLVFGKAFKQVEDMVPFVFIHRTDRGYNPFTYIDKLSEAKSGDYIIYQPVEELEEKPMRFAICLCKGIYISYGMHYDDQGHFGIFYALNEEQFIQNFDQPANIMTTSFLEFPISSFFNYQGMIEVSKGFIEMLYSVVPTLFRNLRKNYPGYFLVHISPYLPQKALDAPNTAESYSYIK